MFFSINSARTGFTYLKRKCHKLYGPFSLTVHKDSLTFARLQCDNYPTSIFCKEFIFRIN